MRKEKLRMVVKIAQRLFMSYLQLYKRRHTFKKNHSRLFLACEQGSFVRGFSVRMAMFTTSRIIALDAG